ncbi:MAG: 1-(5-phosphoribosyl)-5-[(5-phosphoribosylamino)methylideneamino]imidazole-4-carboxamide isomerase [Cyclobacteriaceae bacterium]|nr:1-(5-phosphoribosyl)-5-[(5-phosphoribosylamino)methylideneamino]imidazole-4-carboxamide isomerase [Cyclobacteriaceae bacterium]UYN88283.1 MAG: 1-(5-phosphoribosyl)-5-[(5-phosphoribosylamino)methylideneamino]imidazole-4-carboxamide isomerase [Cyclobacteriaceae bacterium]
MKIIPAIDIIDGKCVRLSQGDYDQKKIYHKRPVDMAKAFEDAGLKNLHMVDLDGAKQGKVINWKTIDDICSATTLQVDFGGGIKTKAEIRQLFEAGVNQVNLGSIAVKEPEKVSIWIDEFGAAKIILSADVRNEMIAVQGWTETSALSIWDFVSNYQRLGIQYVTCTDISTDGMLAGPNITLYKKLLSEFPTLKLIASGGVSSLADLKALKSIGVFGTIVGKAIYEGKISLQELYNLDNEP